MIDELLMLAPQTIKELKEEVESLKLDLSDTHKLISDLQNGIR